jgi:hypothetical protein
MPKNTSGNKSKYGHLNRVGSATNAGAFEFGVAVLEGKGRNRLADSGRSLLCAEQYATLRFVLDK